MIFGHVYSSKTTILELIKNKGANFYYLILGDGPQRKNLEDFIKKSGLEDNVTIVGNVENVHEYLKISDVFIHSSKGEGCSNAILEAMAAGLPIIASNTGGTSEILSDKNGFLFNYQDVEGLYKLIKDSILNIYSLKKMGYSSKQIMEEKFTVKCMMTKYYNIIKKITLVS